MTLITLRPAPRVVTGRTLRCGTSRCHPGFEDHLHPPPPTPRSTSVRIPTGSKRKEQCQVGWVNLRSRRPPRRRIYLVHTTPVPGRPRPRGDVRVPTVSCDRGPTGDESTPRGTLWSEDPRRRTRSSQDRDHVDPRESSSLSHLTQEPDLPDRRGSGGGSGGGEDPVEGRSR